MQLSRNNVSPAGSLSPRRRHLTLLLSTCALGAGLILPPSLLQAQELPTGGTIAAGTGSIGTSGNTMTVTQTSNQLITNWNSFSIGSGATVNFVQPGASSMALNRVTGQDPSQILGNLNANGQVFLINPNGIAIGASGRVQTGAFVASTLGITDSRFLAHDFTFTGSGGSVTNAGEVSGAVVALIAPTVRNSGTITGDTALAAGTDVLLDFDGDGLISVEVKASTMEALAENSGLIKADGGTAILTARGASEAKKGIVNNTGTVEAKAIGSRNGRILLLGSDETNASGSLKAKFVETSAKKVKLDKTLKVETDGGDWLIDPTDINIDADMAAVIEASLASGNVEVSTAAAGADAGDITVSSGINWAANVLTLRADRNIAINATLNGTATAGLALHYGQGAVEAGNTAAYTVSAPVNLASTGSFATKLGSDGAVNSYTIITSLGAEGSTTGTDLQGIAGNLAGRYVLGSDIDASATSGWNSGAGFTPLGNFTTAFSGSFEGLGHTVSNLHINRPSTQAIGLFGLTSGASLSNFGVTGSVTGGSGVGSAVGWAANSTLSGLWSSATVAGSTGATGGLVGTMFQTTLTRSFASGDVSGGAVLGGGVLGAFGGLVGFLNSGTISQSYASGNASTVRFQVGGLVGTTGSDGVIINSYATGNVSGTEGGALVGNNSGTISYSYATGSVSGNQGLFGSSGSNVSNVFYNAATAGPEPSFASSGKTATELLDPFLYIEDGWDFASIWGSPKAGGLPELRALSTQALYDNYIKVSGDLSRAYGDTGSFQGSLTTSITGISVSVDVGSAITGTTNAGTYAWSEPNMVELDLTGGLTVADFYLAFGTGGVTVTPRAVSLTGSRTYNGSTSFSASDIVLGNLANGETLSLSGAATLASRNADQYFTADTNGLTLGNGTGLASNYTLTDAAVELDVTRAVITSISGLAVDSKVYDATTTATLDTSGVILTGMVSGDDLTFNGTAAFLTASAGTGKTVEVTLSTLTGADAANYEYDASIGNTIQLAAAADISQKAITVTGLAGLTRTYDGTTAVTIDQSFAGLNGVVMGDDVSLATALGAYADKNAGNGKIITISGLTLTGAEAGNYTVSVTPGTVTGDVEKAVISAVSGLSALSKVYDGGDAATLDASGAVLTGFVSGDALTLTGSAAFLDPSAGTNKDISVFGLALAGADAGNYELANALGNSFNVSTAATITPKALTLTGVSGLTRIYDGTTAVALDLTGAQLSGIILGDDVSLATALGLYADKNAGTGKLITVSGLTLGGMAAGNYTVSITPGTVTGDVTQAVISSIGGIAALNKTADGTVTATLDTSVALFNGMVTGDTLSVATANGVFADAEPGTGKTVLISGLSLGGADAMNYTLASSTATALAGIAPRPVVLPPAGPGQPTPLPSTPQAQIPGIAGQPGTVSRVVSSWSIFGGLFSPTGQTTPLTLASLGSTPQDMTGTDLIEDERGE
ncbi:S-layer family protein [Pannonibacter sp. I15F10I1]|uniref:beta strand repeat-containing protein n=1 Tax=Pannonibacter sp. I15F10I1 TaxID=2003580 RepID=UPI0016466C2C|nr:YDG domain-containing protein [Pannonibacter sp. I15F10I1]